MNSRPMRLSAVTRVAFFSLLACFGMAGPAQAASGCSLSAVHSPAYLRATGAVSRLPEINEWARTHSNPIVLAICNLGLEI